MPISSFYEGDGEDLPAMATLTSNQLPHTNQRESLSSFLYQNILQTWLVSILNLNEKFYSELNWIEKII